MTLQGGKASTPGVPASDMYWYPILGGVVYCKQNAAERLAQLRKFPITLQLLRVKWDVEGGKLAAEVVSGNLANDLLSKSVRRGSRFTIQSTTGHPRKPRWLVAIDE